MNDQEVPRSRSTTVLCVRRNGKVAMGADGQVTIGEQIVGKATAQKVHSLRNGEILAGFAGSTRDALTLLDHFEKSLDAHSGQMRQAVIEFAKSWGTDRIMRQFNAQLAVTDRESMFLLSGSGDVIVPEHGVLAIGSGMGYAISAARALMENTKKDAHTIVEKSLKITADICVFTNHNINILTIDD